MSLLSTLPGHTYPAGIGVRLLAFGSMCRRPRHNPCVDTRIVRADGHGAEVPLGGVADDQLVLVMRARQEPAERALAELYNRYSGAVHGLARRMLSDEGLAEEVLQETFWRVWRAADQYEPGRVRFGTWLLRITTNLAISERRRIARRPQMAVPRLLEDGSDAPQVEAVDTAPDVPEQVWQAEQRRAVVAGLETLPQEQRQAVELAYFGGLSHSEIAACQGAPLSTVKTRLSLGLRKLADHLRSRRLDVRDAPDVHGAAPGPAETMGTQESLQFPQQTSESRGQRRG